MLGIVEVLHPCSNKQDQGLDLKALLGLKCTSDVLQAGVDETYARGTDGNLLQ